MHLLLMPPVPTMDPDRLTLLMWPCPALTFVLLGPPSWTWAFLHLRMAHTGCGQPVVRGAPSQALCRLNTHTHSHTHMHTHFRSIGFAPHHCGIRVAEQQKFTDMKIIWSPHSFSFTFPCLRRCFILPTRRNLCSNCGVLFSLHYSIN